MIYMKFGQVVVISTRHSQPAHNEHREIKYIEAGKQNPKGNFSNFLIIHSAEHLRQPVMHRCKDSETRSAKHNIMKMCYYKGCIMNLYINSKSTLEKPGEPSD